MKEKYIKIQRKEKRTQRTRKKIIQLANRPRLSVFVSNKYFYAQIIDDTKGKTIVSVNEKEIENSKNLTKSQKAQELGKIIAKKAKEKKVEKVVLDKGSYKYHGRVKLFADSAREGGLVF